MDVTTYIESFPPETRELLKQVRHTIRENAPEAEEGFAYNMPAYKLNGKPLVYFAGYSRHIGFYATPSGHTRFKEELSKYKQGKGSVQFPVDRPLPLSLIAEMVQFRVIEVSSGKKKPRK